MAAPALHPLPEPVALDELIARVGEPVLERRGPPDATVTSVAPLSSAAPGALAFCKAAGARAGGLIASSRATVFAIGETAEIDAADRRCFLRVADPARWFVRAVTALFPDASGHASHPTACIEPGATVGPGCRIGAGAFIGARVTLGRDCVIGPNCSLGDVGLAIERDEAGNPLPYPHLGRLVVGDGVHIGANCVLVRGILEDTQIGDRCQIGNMVNIGHNCAVGDACWISSAAVLCGSATLEDGVMIGAGATVNNHVTIGAGAVVGIGSVVTKSVAPGRRVFGVPAKTLPTMRPL